MCTNRLSPKIGEIYCMKFDGIVSEQSGIRPGLVIQNNTGNMYSPNIIALPLTSNIKKRLQPTHVFLPEDIGLKKDSMVLCENPERMSKEKMGAFITTVPDRYMREIAKSYLLATSVISYIDVETLEEIWNKAVELNSAPVKQ